MRFLTSSNTYEVRIAPAPSTSSWSLLSSLSNTDGSPDCMSYAFDRRTGSPSIMTTRALVLRPERLAPAPSASWRTSGGISSRVFWSIGPAESSCPRVFTRAFFFAFWFGFCFCVAASGFSSIGPSGAVSVSIGAGFSAAASGLVSRGSFFVWTGRGEWGWRRQRRVRFFSQMIGKNGLFCCGFGLDSWNWGRGDRARGCGGGRARARAPNVSVALLCSILGTRPGDSPRRVRAWARRRARSRARAVARPLALGQGQSFPRARMGSSPPARAGRALRPRRPRTRKRRASARP